MVFRERSPATLTHTFDPLHQPNGCRHPPQSCSVGWRSQGRHSVAQRRPMIAGKDIVGANWRRQQRGGDHAPHHRLTPDPVGRCERRWPRDGCSSMADCNTKRPTVRRRHIGRAATVLDAADAALTSAASVPQSGPRRATIAGHGGRDLTATASTTSRWHCRADAARAPVSFPIPFSAGCAHARHQRCRSSIQRQRRRVRRHGFGGWRGERHQR